MAAAIPVFAQSGCGDFCVCETHVAGSMQLREELFPVRGEDVLERALGGDAAGFDEEGLRGEAPDFGEVV